MNMNELFNERLKGYSSYDNARSIASYVDGFKISSRKCIWFSKDLNNYKKVSILKSEISLKSQYLHNEDILSDVIVGFARDFDCSNHINLFKAMSSLGSRNVPIAAQPRYSSLKKSHYYDVIFNKEDEEILEKQYFEGQEIEPKFLVPSLPLLLINGSNGIGMGYSQNILPRHPNDILNAIKKYLRGESIDNLMIKPNFKGYKGSIELLNQEKGKKQWRFRGLFTISKNTITITETTPRHTNESMLEHLNKIKEKKIIKDYKDKSLGDTFNYVISVSPEFFNQYKDESSIAKVLGIETTEVENFVCATENNFIRVFDSDIDILKAFIDIKKTFLQKRKDNILMKLNDKLNSTRLRIEFISSILKKKLNINNRKKQDILEDMNTIFAKFEFYTQQEAEKLIAMPIYSLTQEKVEELNKREESLRSEIELYSNKSIIGIWGDDIKAFINTNKS